MSIFTATRKIKTGRSQFKAIQAKSEQEDPISKKKLKLGMVVYG
jgi:hypothetical protein